jgi:hypothetical protein
MCVGHRDLPTLVAAIPTKVGWRQGADTSSLSHVEAQHERRRAAPTGIVVFVGLSQGAVPLVSQLVFDRRQRIAAARYLPSPWWWLACIAIMLASLAVLAVIRTATPRTSADDSGSSSGRTGQLQQSVGYDVVSGVVLLAGIYNGVAPFVARLVFDGNLLLAFPLRLRAPWWWITSIAAFVATVVALIVIDHAKQRQHADE